MINTTFESSKSKRYQNCKISFIKSSNLVSLESISARALFGKVIDWLYNDGYNFSGDFHSKKNQTRCLLSTSEVDDKISKSSYSYKDFHNIESTDLWIMCATPVKQLYSELFKMLKLNGVESIKTEGLFDKKYSEPLYSEPLHDDLEDTNKYNFRLKRFKASQAQEERPMEDIKKFKAIQAQEEREDFFSYSKNNFSQAICVLGESGSGKSTTIDNILDKSNHNYQYIIPSASTTGLLSQYSPSSGYIPSRLGNMIESAYKNPKSLYTAVFDECHKTNIIEMINDELLQAISKNRNRGVRFISLDEDTKNLYPSAKFDRRGNILIPDNLGFIFISSNARVISGNPDFFNRVDLVEITESDRNIKTINELDSRRLFNNEDKKELVNKILGKYNDL